MLIETIRRWIRVRGFNSSCGAAVVAFAWFAQTGTAAADCVYQVRPATAQEKQSYTNALALFERAVPPTPAGWTSSPPPDRELKEICAPGGQSVSRWSFSRSYGREEGVVERQADGQRRVAAMAADSQAAKKANEAKLAEIDRQLNANMQRMQALAAAQRIAEIEAVNKDIERLMNEKMKLMGVDQMTAASAAIDRDVSRDTQASFGVTVGETNVDTSGFTPYTAPVGRGFRQTSDNRGNPEVMLMIVLPARAGLPGQTVVRVQGDPARAEALLRAARLQ